MYNMSGWDVQYVWSRPGIYNMSGLGPGYTICLTEREREREREVLHVSSHTRLIQVLPGHPLADPRRRNSVHQHKEGQAYESIET